jgi:hypothetical protein
LTTCRLARRAAARKLIVWRCEAAAWGRELWHRCRCACNAGVCVRECKHANCYQTILPEHKQAPRRVQPVVCEPAAAARVGGGPIRVRDAQSVGPGGAIRGSKDSSTTSFIPKARVIIVVALVFRWPSRTSAGCSSPRRCS